MRAAGRVVKFVLIDEEAKVPTQGYAGDAGWDLYTSQHVAVYPYERRVIPTGICVELPRGLFGRIAARSSTIRRGLIVNEAIIDNGYRGELFVSVYNTLVQTVVVEVGQRIAQLVLQEIIEVDWQEVNELTVSSRGGKGFGSSGK